MTGANRFGATGLSGRGVFRGCPVVVPSGSIREAANADLCLLFGTFRVHPPLPLGSADLFKDLSERHPSQRDVRRRALPVEASPGKHGVHLRQRRSASQMPSFSDG